MNNEQRHSEQRHSEQRHSKKALHRMQKLHRHHDICSSFQRLVWKSYSCNTLCTKAYKEIGNPSIWNYTCVHMKRLFSNDMHYLDIPERYQHSLTKGRCNIRDCSHKGVEVSNMLGMRRIFRPNFPKKLLCDKIFPYKYSVAVNYPSTLAKWNAKLRERFSDFTYCLFIVFEMAW